MRINLAKLVTSLNREEIVSLNEPVESLYVHVPFCVHKCGYCDFFSVAGQRLDEMKSFTAAVIAEAAQWAPFVLRQNRSEIRSVFFGGGTPTALSKEQLSAIISELRRIFPIAADAEITVEANPATVDVEYCRTILAAGTNRLSMGAQSFIPSELVTLDRAHNARQIGETVENARKAGFSRVSIDLIYAVPGQTAESWQVSLQKAMELQLSHISCYCLTLEEKTPMHQMAKRGRITPATEQEQLDLMRATRNYLAQHGLKAYETSNYAVPGEECRHNLTYWNSGNYLGIGPAAASHIGGIRWRNRPDSKGYLEALQNGDDPPLVDVEHLTGNQRATELIMLMLRRDCGLSWQRLKHVAGRELQGQLAPAIGRLEKLGLVRANDLALQLTEAGVYVADEVISELVRELD